MIPSSITTLPTGIHGTRIGFRALPKTQPVALMTLVRSARCASVVVEVIQGRHDVVDSLPGESSGREELR